MDGPKANAALTGTEKMEVSETFSKELWEGNGFFESKSCNTKIFPVSVVGESNTHKRYYLLASLC